MVYDVVIIFSRCRQGYFGAMGCLLELMRTGTDDEEIITDEDSDTEETNAENIGIVPP